MKGKMILPLAVFFGLLAAVPSGAATRTYSTEVTNTITTGDINISLEEFQLNPEGRRIPYVDGKLVVPGQRVDKIVTITNEAQKAWIRAKVEYNTKDGLEGMSDDMLGGISSEWKKCGDYFYYTEPVDTAETVDFFRQVVVPWEWDETCEEKGFSIGVTAQAVQAANFVPDFQTMEPWFGARSGLRRHGRSGLGLLRPAEPVPQRGVYQRGAVYFAGGGYRGDGVSDSGGCAADDHQGGPEDDSPREQAGAAAAPVTAACQNISGKSTDFWLNFPAALLYNGDGRFQEVLDK